MSMIIGFCFGSTIVRAWHEFKDGFIPGLLFEALQAAGLLYVLTQL